MTTRSKKLLALETKNTSTRTPRATCESAAQHLAALFPCLSVLENVAGYGKCLIHPL